MDKETLLFLTINELKFIANKFNIDFKIYYENLENKIIFTGTYDDKITIVEKIIKKDTTKSIYKKNNVAFTIKEKLTPNDLVLYNEFKSTNTAVLELLTAARIPSVGVPGRLANATGVKTIAVTNVVIPVIKLFAAPVWYMA